MLTTTIGCPNMPLLLLDAGGLAVREPVEVSKVHVSDSETWSACADFVAGPAGCRGGREGVLTPQAKLCDPQRRRTTRESGEQAYSRPRLSGLEMSFSEGDPHASSVICAAKRGVLDTAAMIDLISVERSNFKVLGSLHLLCL